ncbi:MAG TPA: HigA family addiction module antitoxin [Saprospiraceae bacterium]|nr:HigA family addiction module antitoxin [Saprospiraceae bacterium]
MAEYFVKRPLKRSPVHPGELLRSDVLPALDLSVSDLSEKLKISRQHVHRILAGNQGINAVVALKISKLTGVSSKLLLSMQQNFDLWHAEKSIADELNQIETYQLKDPLVEYVVKPTRKQGKGSSAKSALKKATTVKNRKKGQ